MWKGHHTQNELGKNLKLFCILCYVWTWCGNTQDSPCRGYSRENLCSQGHPLELFTSAGRYSWKNKAESRKVVTPSLVSHRLKNEAERLISLDSQIKYIFLGLGCGIPTTAFFVQLQLKVTQVTNYSYLSLKNMKNGNKPRSHLFICFTLKYHNKENKKLNQILGWEGNELKPFINPEINVS